MSKCLKLCVKQGEELNKSITIKSNGSAMDLTGYTIRFQVKQQPISNDKSIVDKAITESSDINDIGRITSPTQGEVTIHLNEEDTSYPTGEYYLVIALEQYKYKDIISSNCCCNAKYIICEQ